VEVGIESSGLNALGWGGWSAPFESQDSAIEIVAFLFEIIDLGSQSPEGGVDLF
jgi:hypothetical protein